MDAVRLPVLLTVCAMAIMVVRQQRPEFAVAASMAAGTAAFFLLRDDIALIIGWLEQSGSVMPAPQGTVGIMMKAGGVALVSEFASDLCSDAGEKALAGRIDLAERILLTSMCIPPAARLMEQMLEILA